MLLTRLTLFFGCALALLAQSDAPDDASATGSDATYSGPAILSRGETPNQQFATPLAFRPFGGVSAIYDAGLLPISLNSGGVVPSTDMYGVEANLGAYTYRIWKHTTLSLDFRGDYRHYTMSYWDASNSFLSLALTHHASKHTTFNLRAEGGLYSDNYFLSEGLGLAGPQYLQLPQNDLYYNRVIFASVAGDLTYQLTRRLSLNFGGQGTLVRRESSALYGMAGAIAHGDLQYRVTRHTTIGADYRFTRFDYTKGFGGANIHSVGLNYSTMFTRHFQLSARIGGADVQSTSLTEVALDPAVAALVGVTQGIQAAYRSNYIPDIEVRMEDKMRRNDFSASYLNQVTPGNGVYLTSRNNTGAVAYSYTGLRHLNFGINGSYGTMTTLLQNFGAYRTWGGGLGITRDLGKGLHWVVRLDAHHYDIANAASDVLAPFYRHNEYRTSVGFTYSPGDIPLVLW